jgi:ParB family chromosome partitioning protein
MSSKQTSTPPKKKAVGRGITALLGDNRSIALAEPGKAYPNATDEHSATPTDADVATASPIREVPLDLIDVNPWQPRTQFDEDALSELVQSVRTMGIIQAITVRQIDGERYQIINGERRCRAAKIIGLTTIPAYVRTADDRQVQIMALAENLIREDLNPIDVAVGLQNMIDQHDLTQEQVSDIVGKNRATVANFLRLLKLPDEIQHAVRQQVISLGHAKVLMGIEDKATLIDIADKIKSKGLSVRQTETLTKTARQPQQPSVAPEQPDENTKELLALLKELCTRHFKGRANVTQTTAGTRLTLELKTDDDIHYIINKLAQAE